MKKPSAYPSNQFHFRSIVYRYLGLMAYQQLHLIIVKLNFSVTCRCISTAWHLDWHLFLLKPCRRAPREKLQIHQTNIHFYDQAINRKCIML